MFNKLLENKFLRFLKNIVKTLITIFLICLILIIIVQRVTNNNFSIGGIRIFTIVTGSMEPIYEVGDMIISKEVAAKDILVGDDIVYNGKEGAFKDKIVTHRVISRVNSSGTYKFVTKGVNNDLEDPQIEEKQIIGKVIYKSYILSFISKLINNTVSFFILVFIPFVFLIFFEILDIVNAGKKEKENE